MIIPTIVSRRRLTIAALATISVMLLLWAVGHLYDVVLLIASGEMRGRFTIVFAIAFAVLAWNTLLGYFERPYKVDEAEATRLRQLYVTVPVPAYNEDPNALAGCVRSLLRQTRRPDHVFVVDDGSTVSYGDLETMLRREAEAVGVKFTWRRVINAGKRHAQALVFSEDRRADVFVTVDSDSFLSETAIDEVLKPLADPRVGSVAGIVLALNNQRNLLSRLTDLWFVVGQLTDRSGLSVMGSVLVNCGPLAAYRADLIRRHVSGYLTETFAGRRVEFSDDSMLTLYALADGYRAVQQPSAHAFTLMPEKLSHHLRQYLRWMRGATIRSFWRFRYLPVNGYAYWAHLVGWLQMILGTVVFTALVVSGIFTNAALVPALFLVPIAVGYAQALRYLQLKRSDETTRSQLMTFAISPIATLWAFVVLRAVRWYGMATCMKTGWGTRTKGVEVAVAQ